MTMTIGEVAAQTGVGCDTLRYYERTGLLPVTPKDTAGRRAYTAAVIGHLRFIKEAQQAGFRLREIQELLDLRAGKSACCGDVRSLAVAKRRELGQKLRALQAIVSALDTVISTCNDAGRAVNECPILHALEQGLNDEPKN